MVASQPTINQSPMSSVLGGISVPMVAQTLSYVGTSMFAFKDPNNTMGSHGKSNLGFHSIVLVFPRNFAQIYCGQQTFLVTFNSRRNMLSFSQPVFFQTDTSFHNFSAVCSDDWFPRSWSDCPTPDFHSSRFHNQHCRQAGHTIDPSLSSNINYLELFPILIVVHR